MGLGGFFNKLAGGDTNKGGNAFGFVFGADKHFYRRNMESQGSHIQDNKNRLAYFSSPDSNGVLSQVINGVEHTLDPVIVAYEPITELYRFPFLDWAADRKKQKQEGDDGHKDPYESDEILDNSWAEGFSLATQRQDNAELRNRLLQILLLAVLGAVAMFLLVGMSTGLLSDFLSAIPKFAGGG